MADFHKVELDLVTGERITGLFTTLNKKCIPLLKNYPFAYDCRHSENNWFNIQSIEPAVFVNHSGTFLSKEPVPMDPDFPTTPMAAVKTCRFINA